MTKKKNPDGVPGQKTENMRQPAGGYDGRDRRRMDRYLGRIDVWAIEFGCIVGWGAFVMPGTTFLPIAGVAGSVLALTVSTALMLLIGRNYAFLMTNRPATGGVYHYTREAFGREHAFLCSWFLSLSYLTIVFLNATAIFLVSRVVFGNVLSSGIHYEVAGNAVYPGEILLSVMALVVTGVLFVRHKPLLQKIHTVLALTLAAGVLIVAVSVIPHITASDLLSFSGTRGPGAPAGMLTIILLSPWAFIGFDVASLETVHFSFPFRKNRQIGKIIAASIICGGIVYISMALVSASAVPQEFGSWQEYISALDDLSGIKSLPVFYAAQTYLGRAGVPVITVTALAAILTGIIGAYRAMVRMLSTMAEDKILSSEFLGTTFCIVFITGISIFFSFLGRNALNWFIELSSFGATIGFGYTSAAAAKIAKEEKDHTTYVTGTVGTVISFLFAGVHLVSSVGGVDTMGRQSFLLLAIWCLVGFAFYWRTMRQSELSEYNGSAMASVVLFCLLFYSTAMWFVEDLLGEIRSSGEPGATASVIRSVLIRDGIVAVGLTLLGIGVMFYVQEMLRRRHIKLSREIIHAEESSKAKSQFLFNMSHDIRTPMNAIIGYTHLALQEEDLSPTVRGYMEKIDFSGQHLLGLINDILEMSRIENGKMELENAPEDLGAVMGSAYEMFASQMKDKNMDYRLDLNGIRDRYAVFDRSRLMRVLTNLLSNALKFTPDGGTVLVTADQLPAGLRQSSDLPRTERYEIRVKDTGIGMSEEFAGQVFDVFERERTSTVSRTEGTGLGMAITKRIVDAMKGSIDVVTAPGSGTEFIIRVEFPVCDDVQIRELKAKDENAEKLKKMEMLSDTSSADIENSAYSSGVDAGADRAGKTDAAPSGSAGGMESKETSGKKRLLVAEDMEINRQIIEILLENLGYEAEMAENGQEAVDKVSLAPAGYYVAVLMDIQMPVMDGYEATAAIRSLPDPAAANVPVIAVTANAFGEDVRRAEAAGMNAHIAKPIDPEELRTTLLQFTAGAGN